jgi:hypothetical protein
MIERCLKQIQFFRLRTQRYCGLLQTSNLNRLRRCVFEALCTKQKLKKREGLWATNDRIKPILNSQKATQIENRQPSKHGLSLVILLLLSSPSWANTSGNQDPELRTALLKAVSESESFPDRFEAEVWLLDMSTRLEKRLRNKRLKSKNERMEFLRLVHQEATKARLSPELVLSLIDVESAFDRFAVSRVGAQGYMQIMPFWKNEIGRTNDNLLHPPTNLRYGCTILRHYLDKEKGNWVRALARYNGSLGRTVYPDKVMDRLKRYWFEN